LLGVLARLALGGTGTGARSAVVMTLLLSIGAWLACWVLRASPRATLFVVAATVLVLTVAALPVRNAPAYDEREALFRTDQAVARSVPVSADVTANRPTLTILAEAVFPGDRPQPTFGLAGRVGETELTWRCVFSRGIDQYALPVPPTVVAGRSDVDVRLRVTGAPSRETDYLLVYSSAPRGGYLISLASADSLSNNVATTCTLG
jgi:hypothetical protein